MKHVTDKLQVMANITRTNETRRNNINIKAHVLVLVNRVNRLTLFRSPGIM